MYDSLQVVALDAFAVVVFPGVAEPVMRAEAFVQMDNLTHTGIPMEYNKNIMNEWYSPKNIWIVCMAFCAVEKCPKSVDFDQTETSEYWLEADGQVEEVQRQKT